MSIVVPAVLPSSRKDLEDKLALLIAIPAISRIQIDVVDGKFASPACWPYTAPQELQQMIERSEMLPEIHRVAYEIDLMCLDAEQAIEKWLALGATRFTLHAESATDLSQLIVLAQKCCGLGKGFSSDLVSFGLALNLASDLALIEPFIGEVAYVQCMGIARIGQQGLPFDERVFEKVRIFHERHPGMPIQVDGGVSLANAKKLLALGVTNLVVGHDILRAADPAAEIARFEALESSFGV